MSLDLDDATLRNGGHRTVPEAAIVAHLALSGRLLELRTGRDPQATAACRATLAGLIAAGLGEAPGPRFDLAEVVNAIIAQGLARSGDGFWRQHHVETGRRLVADLADQGATDRAPDIARLPPRRFEISFSRSFDPTELPPGKPLRLRLPLPVVDAHLDTLDVAFPGEGRQLPGRLEFRRPAGPEPIEIGAHFAFVAHPGLPHGPRAVVDAGPWLAESEGPIRVTPRVRALAEQLAGTHDPLEKVHAFRDHLLSGFACGMIPYDRVGAAPATDWVLDHRWFDCRLGAALLAALCRAQGIPARLIGGYLLWDTPTEHYWMEAWIAGRGWMPFDLLAWDLSAGGRDAGWRDIYSGAVDYRMKTQVFPDLFTGVPGVPMAAALHRISRAIPGGAETAFVSAADGRLLYRDTIRIVTR